MGLQETRRNCEEKKGNTQVKSIIISRLDDQKGEEMMETASFRIHSFLFLCAFLCFCSGVIRAQDVGKTSGAKFDAPHDHRDGIKRTADAMQMMRRMQKLREDQESLRRLKRDAVDDAISRDITRVTLKDDAPSILKRVKEGASETEVDTSIEPSPGSNSFSGTIEGIIGSLDQTGRIPENSSFIDTKILEGVAEEAAGRFSSMIDKMQREAQNLHDRLREAFSQSEKSILKVFQLNQDTDVAQEPLTPSSSQKDKSTSKDSGLFHTFFGRFG